MDATVEARRQRQREAIWKWRWLGFRDSTPGFKGAMLLIAGAAVWIAVLAVRG
jgi:hypothetical protein